jgi:hypothetical protein
MSHQGTSIIIRKNPVPRQAWMIAYIQYSYVYFVSLAEDCQENIMNFVLSRLLIVSNEKYRFVGLKFDDLAKIFIVGCCNVLL